MKFVRVFALLVAFLAALAGVQDLLSLAVVDGYNESERAWLAVIEILVAVGFGAGAYVVTTREDV